MEILDSSATIFPPLSLGTIFSLLKPAYIWLIIAIDQMFVSPPTKYDAIGGGTFGKWLCHKGRTLMNRIKDTL